MTDAIEDPKLRSQLEKVISESFHLFDKVRVSPWCLCASLG